MKRFISAVLLSAAVAMPTMAQKQKTLGNGYPFTQVPFTSVKISQNTFWGARLKAAREVTVPLAFSKCESEHRYKNFEMAAYTLQHPNHPGLDTKEWDVSKFMGFSFDDTDVYKTWACSGTLSGSALPTPPCRGSLMPLWRPAGNAL